jgi:ribonuclease I
MHGLWPQNKDGTYPEHCNAEAFDIKKIESTIGVDTLKTYWPVRQ